MRIVNFGSLNLDFAYRVKHLVLPGETISSSEYHINCGGKGLNQSVALARAGAEVCHVGKIGTDGHMLKDFLDNEQVDTQHILVTEERTGHAIIQVDDAGNNSIILYGGANQAITADWDAAVLDHFCKGDILLLQNEVSGLAEIMEKARRKGMLIAFNPSPCDDSITQLPLSSVRWLFINETEGQQLSGKSKPQDILNTLRNTYPESAVILTLGKRGVLYKDGDQQLSHPIFETTVADTTAAGDTFTGYFLAGWAGGFPIREILRQASAAAALAVSENGAASSIPTRERVEAFLRSRFQEE